jgi:Tfp pilus assembly protein PilO
MNTTAARTLISILALALVAIPFWLFAVAPKRERSNDLSAQVDKLRSSLAEMTQAADEAAAARKGFTGDYRQFVLLGKAVPADDETASLLVELNHVADASGVEFRDLELDNSTQAGAPPPSSPPAPWQHPAPLPRPRPAPRCCRWGRRSAAPDWA